LAQKVGAELGAGEILLRALPPHGSNQAYAQPLMTRNLVMVLGDQLNTNSAAFDGFDTQLDRVVMGEVAGEAAHVWSHKARIAYFFSAMRHFAETLRAQGCALDYALIDAHSHASLSELLRTAISTHRPQRVIMVEAGDDRLARALRHTVNASGVMLEERVDRHFLCTRQDFAGWAGAKSVRMEHFYRMMRKRHDVLMDGTEPVGGAWNYDHDNRGSFGKQGPGLMPAPQRFLPDAITRAAMDDVNRYFQDHPGSLAEFAWPVTRSDALAALSDFIEHRLAEFGRYQDAMWTDAPFLHHSLVSMALNVKLLDPREVIAAALAAYARKHAPIASVEGFIRQILGWREFIRGVYWRDMPDLAEANFFAATRPLPAWYWTGQTQMRCMQQVIGQTLSHGYAHHIQRLMVTGNFALLAGLLPQAVCDWYLAVYVDAIDWVERPNTAGMALYADGGRFTSKPYAASGAYIDRMSNYCRGCRYQPTVAVGESACPMTVFYWDFLARHRDVLARNPRTTLMVKNLDRKPSAELAAIRARAASMHAALDAL
jgi:deoxyribodipyrimidine photolyase-related protein